MPLFYQQNINPTTQLAIWKIEEAEDFFQEKVVLKQSIKHPHKRLQHLAGRYLLQIISPDFPLNDIEISVTQKPFLANGMFFFSISHCANFAAAIVSTTLQVGLDIEIEKETVAKIAHKFLHSSEQNFIEKLDLGNDSKTAPNYTHLTILWSAKEAMFKWWGKGEVDFSEMMIIDEFDLKSSKTLSATFVANTRKIPLLLEYKIFTDLCLVWVCTKNLIESKK